MLHARTRGHRLWLGRTQSPSTIAQARALRLEVYQFIERRWRAGFSPDDEERLEASFERQSTTLVVMDTDRQACLGAVKLWIGTGSLDGLDLGFLPRPTVRAGRLVVHPAHSGWLLTLENGGAALERVPIALALLGLSVAAGRADFGLSRFVFTCLPKAAPMYRKLGAVDVGSPFTHIALHGDPEPPHAGKYVALVYDHDDVRARLLRRDPDDATHPALWRLVDGICTLVERKGDVPAFLG